MKLDTKENKEDEISARDALKSSLKHLEFISFFEMHLEQKTYCSPHFLKAFENLKHEAQMNVLKDSTHYKKS
jgi:hypothetical protein